MSQYILPYKIGSRSAKALASGLRIKRSKGLKRFRPFTKIINWGNSTANPVGRNVIIANKPAAVANASNKITSLRMMKAAGVSTVEFTTSKSEAFGWAEDGLVVYGRELLNAHSGRGIKILNGEDYFPQLPLYTKAVIKAHEYRVHVAFGEVIDFAKKRKREGGNANAYVKNLDNGWVFCRNEVNPPAGVLEEAKKAVRALGLDFGAVDVLYRERENKTYILEVNTAPGLEGTTLQKYTERLSRWIR